MQKRNPQLKRLTAVAIAVSASTGMRSRAADFQLLPIQDALAREAEPTRNFGGAGALAVAGATAVNGANVPQGQYQTILQFDASVATSAFNDQFGVGNWQLTAARLVLDGVGAPTNPIFNIGAGSISVRWISDDNWLQGMGTPTPPPVEAGGNEISWTFLQTLVAGSTTSLLATEQVVPQNGPVPIPLTLTPQFAGDILAGAFVSIVAVPASASVGVTFHALEFLPDPNLRPLLVLTALPLVDFDGDLNCDDVINLSDISPFVLALTDPEAYGSTFPDCGVERADMNDDGLSDGRDVAGFVDVLIP